MKKVYTMPIKCSTMKRVDNIGWNIVSIESILAGYIAFIYLLFGDGYLYEISGGWWFLLTIFLISWSLCITFLYVAPKILDFCEEHIPKFECIKDE